MIEIEGRSGTCGATSEGKIARAAEIPEAAIGSLH